MEVRPKIATELVTKLKFVIWKGLPLLTPRPVPHSKGMRRASELVITRQWPTFLEFYIFHEWDQLSLAGGVVREWFMALRWNKAGELGRSENIVLGFSVTELDSSR